MLTEINANDPLFNANDPLLHANDPLLQILNDLAAQHAAAPTARQGTHIERTQEPTVITPVEPPAQKVKTTNLNLPDSMDLVKNLNTQVAAIEAIKDPLERQKALMQFDADIAAYKADTGKKHLDFALASNNVPQLQAQLERSRAEDQRQPNDYAMYGDSTITRRIQQQLDSAMSRAEVSAGRTIATDATLASALTKADIFVKSQERFINSEIERTNRKSEQADYILGSLNSDTLPWVGRLYPELAGDERKLKSTVTSLVTGKQNREAMQVFDTSVTEADLPMMAASGNGIASKLTTKLQSERTGQDEQAVAKELRGIQKAAVDEAEFQRIKTAYPTLFTTAEIDNYNKALLLATTDKARAQLVEIRANMLMKLPAMLNEKRLMTDVDSWKVQPGMQSLQQDQEIVNAINTIKSVKNGRPVGISDLIQQYVSKAPKEQQAARLVKIRTIYGSAIDSINKGLYGQVNKETLMLKAQAQAAIFAASDTMLDNLGTTLSTHSNTFGFTPF